MRLKLQGGGRFTQSLRLSLTSVAEILTLTLTLTSDFRFSLWTREGMVSFSIDALAGSLHPGRFSFVWDSDGKLRNWFTFSCSAAAWLHMARNAKFVPSC